MRKIIADGIRDGMVGVYKQGQMAGWGFYPVADQILGALKADGYRLYRVPPGPGPQPDSPPSGDCND